MSLNLANKITILRVFMIPIFLAVYLVQPFGAASSFVACGIFIIAALTDMLDGYIARSRNLITDLGKFMDPLADKLLVCAALVVLTEKGLLPSLVTILIVSRELIITGFRTIAASKNVIMAAGWSGKIKTVFQMIMIPALLLQLDLPFYGVFCQVLIWISAILTIYSAVEYIVKNIKVLND